MGMSDGLASCGQLLERVTKRMWDDWEPARISDEALAVALKEAQRLADEGSTPQDLAVAFELVCQVLQCDAPSEAALVIYYEGLKDYPGSVLRPAITAMLSDYKYRKFPTLAEFVAVLRPFKDERRAVHHRISYETMRRRMAARARQAILPPPAAPLPEEDELG